MAETETAEVVEHKILEEQTKPGSLLILTIEMPEQVVTDRVESVLEDFRKDAQLPGFRPGKAPKELVRRRLGKHARGEALNRVIPDVCNHIIEERNIESLAEPKVDNLVNEEGQPIKFDLVLEVKPEIILPDLSKITAEVAEAKITEKTVQEQLEAIQRANAVTTPREPGQKAKKGDQLTVNVEVFDEDANPVPQQSGENMMIRTGEKHGNPVPDEVVKACVGSKIGETFEVEVTSTVEDEPAEEGAEPEKRDIAWTWKVAVKEIKSVTLPDMDDDFAQDVGDFDTLDALKARIREDLEKQEESRQRDEAVNKILGQVLEQTEFEAPATLIAQAQYNTMMRDSQYLQQMGMSLADLTAEQNDYVTNTRRDAERQVRGELVLEAIGDQAKIEVTDADIDAQIERMAEQAGRKPLAIRAQLEAKKQLDGLKDQIRRRKIADHILETAKVKKTSAKAKSKKKAEG